MLTMRILEDALQDFHPVSQIVDGCARLGGVLLTEEPQPGFACLTSENGGVLCRAGEDSLFFPDAAIPEVANAIAAELKRLMDWKRELDEILSRGGGIQELITASYPVFRNPIFATDELDLVCAKTHHGFGEVNKEWDYILRHGCMPFERMQGISGTEPFRSHHIGEEGPARPFFYCPPGMAARAISYRIPSQKRGVYIGALVIIETERPLTEGTLHLSQILAEAVNCWVQIGDGEIRLKSLETMFCEALQGQDVAWPELKNGLRLYGLRVEELILALAPCASSLVASALSRTLEAILDCFCVEYGERVAILFPAAQMEDARNCMDGIAGTLKLCFGLSGVMTQLQALPCGLRQAETALETGQGGIRPFDSSTAMTYAARELLQQCGTTDGLMHPAVRLLQRYDDQHKTEYLRTLQVWLQCERSAIRSLEELHIHRNTLLYRLERLKALCGEDFSQPDSREHLLLSLRLLSAGR